MNIAIIYHCLLQLITLKIYILFWCIFKEKKYESRKTYFLKIKDFFYLRNTHTPDSKLLSLSNLEVKYRQERKLRKLGRGSTLQIKKKKKRYQKMPDRKYFRIDISNKIWINIDNLQSQLFLSVT